MRVSVLKDDPGYDSRWRGVKVFFNGSERSHVFTADEEQRLIVAARLDERGRMQLTPTRDGVLRETLYGDVRIVLP